MADISMKKEGMTHLISDDLTRRNDNWELIEQTFNDNIGDIGIIQGALANKAPINHTHTIAQITGLQPALNNIPTKTSELDNDNDFATKLYVDTEISELDVEGGYKHIGEFDELWKIISYDETYGLSPGIYSLTYQGFESQLHYNIEDDFGRLYVLIHRDVTKFTASTGQPADEKSMYESIQSIEDELDGLADLLEGI